MYFVQIVFVNMFMKIIYKNNYQSLHENEKQNNDNYSAIAVEV